MGIPRGHAVRIPVLAPVPLMGIERAFVMIFLIENAPTGIRIPVLALRGPRPRPLDDGGVKRILL